MSRLVDCPDCLGLGVLYTGRTKRLVRFDLTKPCKTCDGTGKAFVKRNVLYVGRPDLHSLTTNQERG